MARPSFRGAPVRVRVPATSANLGPGFDSLGLALGLHDVVAVRVVESGLTVDIAGEGADTVRRDKRNLVVRAMRAAFDQLGGQPRGLEVVCANRIPHSRGLGSSSAAIVAGICAARAVALGDMDDQSVLSLASEIEGHPDNVAACLFGGATLAWTDEPGAPHAVRLPLSADIQPVVFVSAGTRQSTKAARALLPDTVPHPDAVRNAGRAALLVHALGARPDLLLSATQDMLHERYRLPTQLRGAALIDRLRSAGVAAVLSGSGTSVLALATSRAQAEKARDLSGRWFTGALCPVDGEGATTLLGGSMT